MEVPIRTVLGQQSGSAVRSLPGIAGSRVAGVDIRRAQASVQTTDAYLVSLDLTK